MAQKFKHRQTQRKKKLHFDRIYFTAVVFLILGSLTLFQLFRIQALKGKDYLQKAAEQHQNLEEIPASRGQIYWQDFYTASAAEFYPAAINKTTYLMFAAPREVQNTAEIFTKLEPFLKKTKEEIMPVLLKKDDPYEPLKSGILAEEKQEIQNLNLIGVDFTEQTERFYPAGEILGNITGFAGFVDNKKIGRYGVEEFFESYLTGRPGRLVTEKDALGRPIGIGRQTVEEPVKGQDLVLTLDRTLQFFACQKLAEYIKKFNAAQGSVIIMNLTNGGLSVMCSQPNFNPNNFSDYKLEDFVNPNIAYTYEPGSIMKPITIAAAIDLEKITADTVYVDTGEVIIDKFRIANSDNKAHGRQTMINVLEKSLNTGAIFAMRQMGRQNFVSYIKKFGFGALSGIELAGEVGGDISALEKGEIYAATASFGQGLTVTPIQMVAAYAVLANDGFLIKPTIAYEKEKGAPQEPQAVARIIKKKTAQTISAMLVSVVKNGYSKKAGAPGYNLGVKTGTAQMAKAGGHGYEEEATIHSAIGYGPISENIKPIFVMLVKLDRPQGVRFAESSASPLFGEIAQFLLQYYKVPPEEETLKH